MVRHGGAGLHSLIQKFCVRNTTPVTKSFLLDEARQLAQKQFHGSQLTEEVHHQEGVQLPICPHATAYLYQSLN
jgi:hypothetical protein